MKETYADYVIVNVSNYTIRNNEAKTSLKVSELKCLPRNFEKALNVGYDETIEKYLFSPILPFTMSSEKFLGAGVLCKIDEKGVMDVCGEVGADTGFYTRSTNLAQIIDSYKREMKVDKDRQIINHLASILSNMLSNRLMGLYSKTNNLALCFNAQKSLSNLNGRVMSLNNLENLVIDIQNYEDEFKKQKLSGLGRSL